MAQTIGGNLLRYLGLVGTSGLHTGSLVPKASSALANEQIFRDFEDAGRVADPDIWTRYNTTMRRPATFDAMLQLWDEMSEWDLMKAALVEVVDEATQVDANSPSCIWYQCNDRQFEEELNDMLVRVGAEELATSQYWHVAGLGNHFEKIEYAPQEGVMGLSFVHPIDMRRYWLERNRKCIGFRWTGHKPNKEAAFVAPDNQTPVERVQITNGRDIEDLWYPWDFLHFRRMFRLRHSEHGEPLFDEAQGIYKKLRIAIDQMVVHRAQVQPDRYSINIDVQEQPPAEQMRTVNRWKLSLRSKLAFGQQGAPNTLNQPSDFSAFYNAMALDTILYVAQPKGFNHVVNKIQGTQQVPDVYDIELLTDLFYSIIGMPRSWFGGQKDQQTAPSGKALLAQDIRFLRKIKSLRKPLLQGYTWLGYFHALLRGKDVRQLDIKAMAPPIGSLEEQMKLEMLKLQTEVLDLLADVMQKYRLPKEAWVETIFKRYLHLPDDIVNVFITALPTPVEGADAMQGAGGPSESKKQPPPYAFKLIREIQKEAEGNKRLQFMLEKLKHMGGLQEGLVEQVRRRQVLDAQQILNVPQFKPDGEIVINSMGAHPLELKIAEGQNGMNHKYQPLNEALNEVRNGRPNPLNDGTPEEPAYRRYMPDHF